MKGSTGKNTASDTPDTDPEDRPPTFEEKLIGYGVLVVLVGIIAFLLYYFEHV